jgi:hypothetical protein
MSEAANGDGARRVPPVSLRLHGWVRDWYAARAADEGTTPHALMVRVLTEQAIQTNRRKRGTAA